MEPYVPLLAENLPQQRYLEAIFQDLTNAGRIKIDSRLGRDSTLAGAEAILLRYPGRHVAIVLETNSDDRDEIMEFDRANRRRLSRTDPSGDFWYVALAIPRLDAWALIDEHVRQEFSKIRQDPAIATDPKEREKIERANYLELAARIHSFVQGHPFDLETLKQKSRQCRELCEFIDKSLQPAAVPATASEWF
jgi:hypothetical protein